MCWRRRKEAGKWGHHLGQVCFSSPSDRGEGRNNISFSQLCVSLPFAVFVFRVVVARANFLSFSNGKFGCVNTFSACFLPQKLELITHVIFKKKYKWNNSLVGQRNVFNLFRISYFLAKQAIKAATAVGCATYIQIS